MWLQNTRFFVYFSFVHYRVIVFLVILTSFFIKILLPRVLQIEIYSFIQLLITLYLIPSKSVAEEHWSTGFLIH